MKSAKRLDAFIILFSVIGAIWAWNTKQSIIGYITTGTFLFAAMLGVLAYYKHSLR